jgi:hypothetical protein
LLDISLYRVGWTGDNNIYWEFDAFSQVMDISIRRYGFVAQMG